MVVAPQPLAAEIGAELLARGGNAFDAAIGTAFAQMVTDPQTCGLGGFGCARSSGSTRVASSAAPRIREAMAGSRRTAHVDGAPGERHNRRYIYGGAT